MHDEPPGPTPADAAIPLDLAALRAARARIAAQVEHTPQPHSAALSERVGAPLWLKLENLQQTGSFKLRGASLVVDALAGAPRPPRGVIAASAGNHAQAVAWAARRAGLRARVLMPRSAPLTKIEACRSFGAEVELVGETLEEAGAQAERQAQAQGLALVHPYDDWRIVAGQASVGLELLEDLPEATVVVVPLGGGGLLSGIALAVKLQRPDVRIVGVQADAVAPWRHFLDDGGLEPVTGAARTIADGIRVKAPGQCTRQVIARYVDRIVTVDEDAIARAIVTLLEATRTIGEGAGVVALAALLQGLVQLGPDDRVACVVSGGNIDMSLVGRSIDFGLAASGRLLHVAVTLPDLPGRLAALLATVADLGMNVREVQHRRGELQVPVGMTEITLALETRDRGHQRALLAQLAEQGLATRVPGR